MKRWQAWHEIERVGLWASLEKYPENWLLVLACGCLVVIMVCLAVVLCISWKYPRLMGSSS